jgi:hypothetical protein
MFYVKNVPLFERILRALLGLALATSALFIFLQHASFVCQASCCCSQDSLLLLLAS